MQKFKKGSLVRIAKDLGDSMSHFTADRDAVVLYSYAEECGGENTDSYGLHIEGNGHSAWYEEHQLTLIEEDGFYKLKQWEDADAEEEKIKSDIDWIFKNGKEVAEVAHGATIKTLAMCLNITNLWGNHGEGYIYYQNAHAILAIAKPFLLTNDKDGYIAKCNELLEKEKL